MIGWRDLGTDALWVLGLTLLLATLSYTDWCTRRHATRWREATRAPSFVAPVALGLSLITLSLFLKAHHLLERALWIGWTALLVAQMVLTLARQDKG